MSGIRQEGNDTGKLLRPPVTETHDKPNDTDDPTTLKFDGPVRLSDEDAGADPYNRTGRFKRLIRG
ncbi:MAG: hypothetical protein ABI640_20845 [Gammaproteobacteria bacterium]